MSKAETLGLVRVKGKPDKLLTFNIIGVRESVAAQVSGIKGDLMDAYLSVGGTGIGVIFKRELNRE